jgi:RNA polymerase sigma-54 factor
MDLKQHLRLSQQLVMTPQLQQAIKLLQLSRLELIDEVRKELDNNPVLSDEEPPDGRNRGGVGAEAQQLGVGQGRERDDRPVYDASRDASQ